MQSHCGTFVGVHRYGLGPRISRGVKSVGMPMPTMSVGTYARSCDAMRLREHDVTYVLWDGVGLCDVNATINE